MSMVSLGRARNPWYVQGSRFIVVVGVVCKSPDGLEVWGIFIFILFG